MAVHNPEIAFVNVSDIDSAKERVVDGHITCIINISNREHTLYMGKNPLCKFSIYNGTFHISHLYQSKHILVILTTIRKLYPEIDVDIYRGYKIYNFWSNLYEIAHFIEMRKAVFLYSVKEEEEFKDEFETQFDDEEIGVEIEEEEIEEEEAKIEKEEEEEVPDYDEFEFRR